VTSRNTQPRARRRSRALIGFVALLTVSAVLAGCTSDPLAEQYADGTDTNYISGDGVYKEYAVDDRGDSVSFEGETDEGATISSEDYAGEVYVVNFWYAGCPPCRAEAPDLQQLSIDNAEAGVNFLGVNTYDQEATSLAFARSFGVTYPSILDANDVNVQFAFSASVAPNAVPTTLVVDREGRVAARWSGLLSEPSILQSMIDRVVAEES
jgi:thiol-disulfide isomerase/thioredoxin